MPRKPKNIENVTNAVSSKANAIQNKEQGTKQPATVKEYIIAMLPGIKKALPSMITPDRFLRMMQTALQTTPKLNDCSASSVCVAMIQAAQLGLEPNTALGQAYLIPYGKQCQFQIGYKGLLALAHRTKEFKTIYAQTVYENDEFEYEYGLEPKMTHKPATKNRGKAVAYYAVYHLVNGGFGFEVMSREDIENHAKQFSQAYKQGRQSPWSSDFDSMAKKTVLKQLLKYAPLSAELGRGVAVDETVKSMPRVEDLGEINILDLPNDDVEFEVEGMADATEAAIVEEVEEKSIPGQESMLGK